jgi:opacity protein-like surface antigen
MKKILILIMAIGFVASCGQVADKPVSTTSSTGVSPTIDEKTAQGDKAKGDAAKQNSPVLGTYTGGFEATAFNENKDYVYENRITIAIDSISDDVVNGHSVVAGNNRPFKGTVKQDGKLLKVEAAEPGDDKYDGKFSFTIDSEKNTVSGTWKANDNKLDVTERKYTLAKKQFKYDASLNLPEDVQWTALYDKNPKFPDKFEALTADVTKFNASAKELTKKDVENLYKGDLEIIRNAIYARHGYSFKNRRLRFIFDQFVPWYMPLNTDIRSDLTEIEKKNIDLIKRYEDHAEKYYDEYGR